MTYEGQVTKTRNTGILEITEIFPLVVNIARKLNTAKKQIKIKVN